MNIWVRYVKHVGTGEQGRPGDPDCLERNPAPPTASRAESREGTPRFIIPSPPKGTEKSIDAAPLKK
jgi:hypothetical protein